MFVLTSNWFWKWFSGKLGVWLLLQIWSNWKAFPVNRKSFPVDRKLEPKQQKIIFIFIFTSNDFRPWKIEERERERARRSPTSEQEDRIRARRCTAPIIQTHPRQTQSPIIEIISPFPDHMQRERQREYWDRRTANPLTPTNPDESTRTDEPRRTHSHREPTRTDSFLFSFEIFVIKFVCDFDFLLSLFDLWFCCCCCGGVGGGVLVVFLLCGGGFCGGGGGK